MEEVLRIGIFGDSLMKATLPDDSLRYHFHQEILDPFLAHVRGVVVNKAKFGATIRKGKAILQKDLESGNHYDYALLEYGGNDCNHDWPDVASRPDGDHFPVVSLQEFTDTLTEMIDQLQQAGVKPILMTLPPIDSEKYLNFLNTKGSDRVALLHWLRDANRIYRTQELYSDAVYKLSVKLELPCIDVRAAFLQQPDFTKLISEDGIHPSAEGYNLLYATLIDALQTA